VDAAEEHHGGLPDETPITSATVGHITEVHCRYAPRPQGDARTHYPVEGSGVLTVVTSADGRPPAHGDLTFVGYLVQLAIP
jgi:hypothetical protein